MRKSFIKKTVAILLVATTGFVYFSCQQDESVINTFESKSKTVESKSVIDYEVSKIPWEMTAADSLLADQAFQIMDYYVFLQKDGYVLTATNGASIGLSERVFNYYKAILDQTNEMLKGAVLIPLGGKSVEVRPPGYTPVQTRNGGGVTKIVFDNWPKFSIYLSNQSLKNLARGTGLAATLSGSAPEPVLSKVILIAGAFCYVVYDTLADYYPKGIIISCISIPTIPIVGCVPYNLTSQ